MVKIEGGLVLWLTAAGVEVLAQGHTLREVHFSLAEGSLVMETQGWAKLWVIDPGALHFPDQANATKAAVETLERQIVEVNQRAFEHQRDMRTRINNLLCIEGPKATPQPSDDDIPF